LDPEVQNFINASGFKVLALARLNPTEYSLTLYLLNCAFSGLNQIVTTDTELASLLGYSEEEVQEALNELVGRQVIRLRYSDKSPYTTHHSLRVGMQYDTSRWALSYKEDATSTDAIVFPFRRQGHQVLTVIEGQKKPEPKVDDSTWQRIATSYFQGRSVDDDEIAATNKAAQILVETHPVDQVLLILRHFGTRVPTLSLLASSWSHYQEVFERETQKIDIMEARQKHQEMDTLIREHAQHFLDLAVENDLNETEINVLNILIKHRHPRRQLFWAYQARSRYENLESFFADNVSLMLKVTTHGSVVKVPD
jgi:hypothetical protein